jgi:hypothetical protein
MSWDRPDHSDTSVLSWLRVQAEWLWNMNAKGDTHVSFFASQLCVSPDGAYLLVATSAAILLIFAMPSTVPPALGQAAPTPLITLHGLKLDTFHLPCTAWHPAGAHVLAADCNGTVQVC